jgi:hypothetical protein
MVLTFGGSFFVQQCQSHLVDDSEIGGRVAGRSAKGFSVCGNLFPRCQAGEPIDPLGKAFIACNWVDQGKQFSQHITGRDALLQGKYRCRQISSV